MKLVQALKQRLEMTLPVLLLQSVSRQKWMIIFALVVWANAVAVAYVTHQVRTNTAYLEQLKHEQYQLEMEWEALRLEQGALAEHNRIENLAKKKLAMKNVAANDEIVVEN
jgi:cell division protein FtsL